MSRELLQQALFALELAQEAHCLPATPNTVVYQAAAAIRAHLAAQPAPAVPRHVRKIGGSFQHTGTVVADFKTTAGEPRIVLEFDAPVAGMLHVYRPDQVEPCEPVAPAAPPAAPAPGEPVALESVHLTRDIKGMCTVRVNGRVAIQDNGDIIDHMATLEWFAQPAPVPLTEGRITAIANELAFGGGHCNVYELARAIEAAHGITGGKP